jgi:hypothetical protein
MIIPAVKGHNAHNDLETSDGIRFDTCSSACLACIVLHAGIRRGDITVAELRIAVEGEGAVPATEALLLIPGLSGTWTSEAEARREPLTLATIATIVGIVGGVLEVAEQVHKWYQEHRQAQAERKIDRVLIVGRQGQRLLLEGATVEDIRRLLEN